MAIENISKLINFGKEFWKRQDTSNLAMRDKVQHVYRVCKLAEKQQDDLLTVCCLFHDIGRVPQLELLGGFKDDIVLHHHLGTNLFEQWLYKGLIESTVETDAIREVIAYHGRVRFLPEFASTRSAIMHYIDVVSVLDDIDNGCVGAVGYLDREVDEDAKDYVKNNPGMDQKRRSLEVMYFFSEGKKFDKLKYCKTYADYILFAIVLAINSLIGPYSETAVQAMNMQCTDSYGNTYESALAAYKAILYRRLWDADAEACYEILEEFYNKAVFKRNI